MAVLRSQGSRGQTSLENGKWRTDGKSNHMFNSMMEKDLEWIQERSSWYRDRQTFVSCLTDRLLRRQDKKMRCLGKLSNSKGRERRQRDLGRSHQESIVKCYLARKTVFCQVSGKKLFKLCFLYLQLRI